MTRSRYASKMVWYIFVCEGPWGYKKDFCSPQVFVGDQCDSQNNDQAGIDDVFSTYFLLSHYTYYDHTRNTSKKRLKKAST